jgi:hypothetical protein
MAQGAQMKPKGGPKAKKHHGMNRKQRLMKLRLPPGVKN